MNPTWTFGLIILALAVVVAVIGVLVVRRRIPVDRLKSHNEVTGPLHATIGVIFALLAAFIVVVVWEQMDQADQAVAFESATVIALSHDLRSISDPASDAAHKALVGYCESVLEVEWPILERGGRIEKTTPQYRRLWDVVRRITPKNEADVIWLTSTIDRLGTLDKWRSQRLLSNEQSIPTPMWIVLVIAALITILFAALFGASHRPTHIVMISSLAILVAAVLFLIAAIDHPFSGIVRVEATAMEHAEFVVRSL